MHGFSGNKPHENKEKCGWLHPKVCQKLFRYGFSERGCKGKAQGCTEFHPKICKDLLDGVCEGKDCKKGFHLRSIKGRNKDKNEKVDDKYLNRAVVIAKKLEEEDKKEKVEVPKPVTVSESSSNTTDQAPFLEIMKMMKDLQATQIKQEERLEKLLREKEEAQAEKPPAWFLKMMKRQ